MRFHNSESSLEFFSFESLLSKTVPFYYQVLRLLASLNTWIFLVMLSAGFDLPFVGGKCGKKISVGTAGTG
jgi:hypothetical protein